MSQTPQLPASGLEVFISHAGEQKRSFAYGLLGQLREAGLTSFLDEESLRLGDVAADRMRAAVQSCSVFMMVLTQDWMRKKWTTLELQWALDTQKSGLGLAPGLPHIIPLFYGVEVDELTPGNQPLHDQMVKWHGPLADQRWQELLHVAGLTGKRVGDIGQMSRWGAM